MLRTYLMLWAVCILWTSTNQQSLSSKPDTQLTTPELIQKYGYPAETHEVLTTDGYFLTMHRIPPRRGANRPVVLLVNGLLSSSADWVVTGPNNGLAYILSDAGYDVWLGNTRGNVYSKRHLRLSPRDKQFWNYSWHEIGVYDVPSMVDHALNVSRQRSLYYIGHSMGGTDFYVYASTYPAYNSKIRLMVGLAPASYNYYNSNPFFRISSFSKVGAEADKLYNSEIFTKDWAPPILIQTFCRDMGLVQELCSAGLLLLAGTNSTQTNKKSLPVILSHFPAGASLKCWVHYGQQLRSGKFRQYDHGRQLNLKLYGTAEPPEYNTTVITAPVASYVSDGDDIIKAKDVDKLHRTLGNSVGVFRVPLPTFNHLDFLWGVDVKSLVYDSVIDLMAKF
ncbi:lipase 1-like [Periplaneta americana]|uniref:lipase 1-like n=1 Tax=Periplaneta americana TaxID=6978 RepID=UPI0037E9B987